MRLFIGIPLSAETSNELSQISMRLQSREGGLRWSAPESWHITLQFLGNSSHEQYDCVVPRLKELRLPAVSITLESLGFFARAGIFYVEVRNTKELAHLEKSVIVATAPCGFTAEDRPYHPHITLARGKGKQSAQALTRLKTRIPRAPRFTSFLADNFLLYESFTEPSGSRYEVRESFAFVR
ncbi:MAG: RNA 2',3'-cyclic phosphodiesterase [Acidobacteriaceae bacterium]